MPRPDTQKTEAFTLGPPVDKAQVAVLLLHGFTGSPWELRPVGEALAARGAHVVCPRLPGHGTVPEAMLWSGQAEWLQAATKALESLRSARRVAIVGLSMGGLLGLILAARFPTQVQGLVLMAPAVRLKGKDAWALRKLRHVPVFDLKEKWLSKTGSDIEAPEVKAEAPLLWKYPLSRVLDLFQLQDLASAAERRITCPSLVIGAVNDHIVDTEEVMALQKRLPFSRGVLLQRGFHLIPRDTDRALALTEIAHFIDGLS